MATKGFDWKNIQPFRSTDTYTDNIKKANNSLHIHNGIFIAEALLFHWTVLMKLQSPSGLFLPVNLQKVIKNFEQQFTCKIQTLIS